MIEPWETSLFQAVGWVLLLGVVTQTGMALLLSLKRFRLEVAQHDLKLGLVKEQISLDTARFQMEWQRTQLSWNGIRKFRIVSKVVEGDAIQSFYLRPHDGKPLPPFLPGQYLTFSLRLPGSNTPVTRCYSLSSSPLNLDSYRVTIKRVLPAADQPDAPPGLVSNYFHDQLEEGDIVDVKAPGGHFFLDIHERWPVVLVGGGIGITPVFSMLETLCSADPWREVWFFYGVRHPQELIWQEALQQLAEKYENLSLHICFSQAGEAKSAGRVHTHRGRVTVERFKKQLPSSNYLFYMCGPAAMMSSLSSDLQAWDVPKEHINFETFGPSSVKKKATADKKSGPALQVTFAHSEKSAQWTESEGSLLDLAEASGAAIASGCRTGSCHTCLTAIKSGEIDYLEEPGQTPEDGSCLVCIATPKTDLVLEA